MAKKKEDSDKTMLGGRYYTKDEREKAIQNAVKSAQEGQYKEAGQLKGGSVKEAPKKQKYKAKTAGQTPLQPIKVDTAKTLADVATGQKQEKEPEAEPQKKFSEEANGGRRSNNEYQKQKQKSYAAEANSDDADIDAAWADLEAKAGEKNKAKAEKDQHRESAKELNDKIEELERQKQALYQKVELDGTEDQTAKELDEQIQKYQQLAKEEESKVNTSDQARDKLLDEYNQAVEKERETAAYATDPLSLQAAEEATKERKELEEQLKDSNREKGNDVYAGLADEAQSRDLFEGWAGERAAGSAATIGTGLEWLGDKFSNLQVEDPETGEIRPWEENPFTEFGANLTNAGQAMTGAAQGWQEQAAKDWESGTEDMSDLGKQAAGLGKTAADMTLDMVENFIMPGAGRAARAMRVGGQGALTQAERAKNDIDARAGKMLMDGGLAFMSEYLVGGAEAAYGKSVLGKGIDKMLQGASPAVRVAVKAFLNTEGVEEGLEYSLGYAGDKILGFDDSAEFSKDEFKQNVLVGYIMGVLFNGVAGGISYDAPKLQAVADEGIEAMRSGMTPEQIAAAATSQPNEDVKVVPGQMKETPAAETETPTVTPDMKPEQKAEALKQMLNDGSAAGREMLLTPEQAFQVLSDLDLFDAYMEQLDYTPEEARQILYETAGVHTGQEAEATAAPEQETAEPTASEANPEAEAPKDTNTQPEANTNEKQGNTNGNPEQKKRKTDHSKQVLNPDENTDSAYEDLNQKNGSIEKGENPARDINVPKKDTKGNKVGEGARTILEADATPEERVASLKAAVVNGNFGHIPVTNESRSKSAVKTLSKDGWSKSAANFLASVDAGKVDADTIALGAHLLNEAGNSTEASGRTYIELAMAYNDAVSGTGQALAASRILKTLTPEGKLYGMEKTIEKMNKKIREKNEKKSPNKQKAEVKLDEGLVEEYLKAETDEQRDAIHDEIIKDVASQVPNTLRDKFVALRYLNMLGNLKTQARNVLGNAGMGLVQKTKNETVSVIEGIASKVSGGKYERKYKGFYAPSLHKAAVEDFKSDKSIKKAAMGEAKFSDVGKQAESEIEEAKDPFNNKNPIGWVLNKYSKATTTAMEVGDEIFVQATYADALAGYLNAHGIKAEDWKAMVNDPEKTADVDKARAYAIKQAQEATFRDTNPLSKFVSTFDNRWGKIPKAITQGVLPFRKTPTNVLVRMEEYSPLGIVNTAVKAGQAIKGNADASEVIDSFAKTLTGSGLAALGYMLKQKGFVRTKEDDKDKERLDKLEGKQDYSVEFELPEELGGGRRSFTLDWLTPASGSFFMGAELANIMEQGEITPSQAMSVLTSFTNPMLEMSMLSGVNDALNNLSDFDGDNSAVLQFALNSAWSYLTQGISNTLAGQVEQYGEEFRQTYYTDKDNPLLTTSQQKKVAKLGNKTPGVDFQNADYIDAWGRKQENDENMVVRAINVFANPGYVSKMDEKATEADAIIEDLLKFGKEQTEQDSFPDVVPKSPSRETTVNGVKLSPEEYDVYATTKGQESLNAIIEASQTEAFQNADKFAQAETIADIYSYSEFLAAAKIAEERGEEYYNDTYSPLLTGQKEDGENTYKSPIKEDDIPEYLAYKNAYDKAMKEKDYDAVDALIDSSKTLPKSAQVGATQRAKDMEKLADLKETGLSSAKVYYQFQDDMKTIYEGEKRTAPKSSDYIRTAGSGKYSEEDADAIMNYERKVSQKTLERYQEQVKYNLEKAGMGSSFDAVWKNVQKVAEGEWTTDQFKKYAEKNIPIKYRQAIRDVASDWASDRHVAGKTVSGIYRSVRDVGYTPEQALKFYEMIDSDYNGYIKKAELDAACAKAFGKNSKYGKQVRKNLQKYIGK